MLYSLQLILAGFSCGVCARGLLQASASSASAGSQSSDEATSLGQRLYQLHISHASAHNLSVTATTTNLPATVQRDAFAEAIKKLLLDSGNNAGTLIEAALLAKRPAAVPQAFAQATQAPLQFLCRGVNAAQAASAAAGQAARSALAAISTEFQNIDTDPDPCKLFQGSMHLHDSHISYTGPSLDCQFLQSTSSLATVKDCFAAIDQISARGPDFCHVSNNASTQVQGGYRASFGHAGTCDVYLGASRGSNLSLFCPLLDVYARNVVTACQDLKGDSGGALYPAGTSASASGLFVQVDYPRAV